MELFSINETQTPEQQLKVGINFHIDFSIREVSFVSPLEKKFNVKVWKF